jgi:hypothetical protein
MGTAGGDLVVVAASARHMARAFSADPVEICGDRGNDQPL